MKSKLVLLLTQDVGLEEQSTKAVRKSGGALTVARTVGEALQIVCARGRALDLALIDFDNGSRGMTLLSALKMLRWGLPIMVVTSIDTHHVAALAYANGAAACLAKPICATELEIAIRALGESKLQLEAA